MVGNFGRKSRRGGDCRKTVGERALKVKTAGGGADVWRKNLCGENCGNQRARKSKRKAPVATKGKKKDEESTCGNKGEEKGK